MEHDDGGLTTLDWVEQKYAVFGACLTLCQIHSSTYWGNNYILCKGNQATPFQFHSYDHNHDFDSIPGFWKYGMILELFQPCSGICNRGF